MPLSSESLQSQLSQERYALNSLLEFVRILTPDLGPLGIIKSVVRTVMGKSLIKDAYAYLELSPSDDERMYRLVTQSGFRGADLPKILTEADLDTRLFNESTAETRLRLLSPDGQRIMGVLVFGSSSNPNLVISAEEPYLASLAALTSIALTNAWLFEREKERERLDSELRLAREIQQSLLPQRFPEIGELEFAAVSRPSEWVGGDYYDVVGLDDRRVLVAVGDVVGKGVTAALTMSNLQAAMRALASLLRSGHLNLLDAVRELNRLMCESTAAERFITAVIGIVDIEEGTFEACVCGHPKPLIAKADGTRESVETTGIPLGILPEFTFETRVVKFEKGSVLVIYTDGFSEAKYQGRMIGPQGIEKVVENIGLLEADLQTSLDRIVASTQLQVEDDITILAVRRKVR